MRAVLVILGLYLASPTISDLNAQEFDLLTSTRTEFGGSLDFIMRLMGANGEQSQRLRVSGAVATVRTDDIDDDKPTGSNIVDYSSGMITVIDHEDRSYFTYNLADLLAAAPFQMSEQPQVQENQQPAPDQDGAEYELSLEVTSPGGNKTLLGYLAEPTWITLTATPTKAPEGVSLDSMPIFKMLTELWVAEDFPGNTAMEEISKEAAAYLSKSMAIDGDAMTQAFSQNPQFADAFKENQEELEKLRSMPLEQLSVFVALSPGAEFLADSALHGSMGELKIDVKGAVASGVANAVTGGIRGRLGIGRRREPEPPPAPVQATQTLMFRVHELVQSFTTGPLEGGWNVVDSTYEQKESPFQARPQGN